MNAAGIDVSIEVSGGVEASVDRAGLQAAAVAALQVLEGTEERPLLAFGETQLEISILVTDDAEIRRLNREYRGVDRPTDILSFSLVADDDGNLQNMPVGVEQSLGDIVISHSYASRQADELGHSLPMELAWLVIHGTLQLVGYSHDTDASAEHMEALEQAALRRLGFTRL
jgi:probable rRNA maturation factor